MKHMPIIRLRSNMIRLKGLRVDKGLTQEELTKELSLSRSTIR